MRGNRSEVIKLVIAIIVLVLSIIAGFKMLKSELADSVLESAYKDQVTRPKCACQIKYVAESEIMGLEKARARKEGKKGEEQSLFFGDIDKALELTMKIASYKNDENTKVVFSLSPVYAEGVESISKEVHEEVIRQMRDRNIE